MNKPRYQITVCICIRFDLHGLSCYANYLCSSFLLSMLLVGLSFSHLVLISVYR